MVSTEAELRERVTAEEARWKAVAEQIQRQYDMERAAHMGRLALLKELLGEDAENGDGAEAT